MSRRQRRRPCARPTTTPSVTPSLTRVPPSATLTPTRRPTPTSPVSPLSTPSRLSGDGAARLDAAVSLRALPSRRPLLVHFDQPIDTASTDSPLVFVPSVEGTFIWDDTQTLLIFTPALEFTPGRDYEITLSRKLKTADGGHLPSQPAWKVQIAPAPEVSGYYLSDDEARSILDFSNVRARKIVARIVFDRPMDTGSVADALRLDPPLRYSLSWEDNVLVVENTDLLSPDTSYALLLGPAAMDATGTPLKREYRWTLKTTPVVKALAAPDEKNPQRPVTVYFNYALDPSSVEKSLHFTPPVSGTFEWDKTNEAVTFNPDEPLPMYTDFEIAFEGGFLDAHDGRFSPPPALRFTTLPPVLATSPTGSDVFPATSVQVTFDRLMDKTTTEAAFTISPTVTGTLTWDENILIFTPDAGYLGENTHYVVRIGAGARGRDGETLLGKPYFWSFTTRQLTKVLSFGDGSNAQVVDADGRRSVQFMLYIEAEEPPVTLALYRFSLEQFLDRYSSGFRGGAGWEINRSISKEGALLVKRWTPELRLPKGGDGGLLAGASPVAGQGRSVQLVEEAIIPDDVSPGLYLLELESGYVNDQLILVLTRNALMLKQAEGQIVAWVADIPDPSPGEGPAVVTQTGGLPVPGATVGVYTRDGQVLSQGKTGADGVFRARVERTDPAPYLVIAQSGDDFTVSGLSDEWRSDRGGWWGWWRPAPQVLRYAASIYTDRPIYKPGQQVFFKAIVRKDDDGVVQTLPSGTAVTVRIRDARNNVVQTFDLATNAFGSVDGVFNLAEGAMSGKYAVEAALDGETHRQVFKVEDYRKPDYEVKLGDRPQRILLGENVRLTATSTYYFGEPVAGADIEVKLFQLSELYWWESSENGRYIWYQTYGNPLANGKTGTDGTYNFSWKPNQSSYWQSVDWYTNMQRAVWGIEATVSDNSNQSVSNFAVVEIYNVSERIILDASGYFHKPGEPFALNISVVDIDGNPVAGRELKLSLRRWDRSDYDSVLQSFDVTMDDDGRAKQVVTLDSAGYYQLYASGNDAGGREITARRYVYAHGNLSQNWYGRNSLIAIDADRETYAPGDTAHLIIESAFDGPALLTFERGTTRREQVVELTAPVTLLDVPVQETDSPNIFVTINAWRGQALAGEEALSDLYYNFPDAKLLMDTVELQVPALSKVLTVTLTPDQDVYGPRDEATFTVRVTDYLSRPVRAEVSLALVDEAIFALSEDLSGPMFEAFYALRQQIVRTYDAMALFRYLGYGDGRGGGGDGENFAGNPRSDFPDTAFWLPALRTDANGVATINIKLPDNLTRWRLTAKAVTAATQVGEAKLNITTRQAVVVRPQLPRVLTAGDDVLLSAMIHNYADTSQAVSVTLDISPAVMVKPLAPVTLKPGEVRVVGWTVALDQPGTSEILMQVVTKDGVVADAVALSLPVQPLAVPDVTTTVGQFQNALTATVVMPEEALPVSRVKLELNRSIAGTLLTGLEYLTGFPYGCVEQTMSAALPNAVVGRAIKRLGVSNSQLEADLPPKIQASLQRLFGYQHTDGGWGWWYDDSTDAYQTAWVVFGLATTREAGYEVDSGVISRGIAWLNANLEGMDIRTRAYALYSMAVAGSPNVTATLSLQQQLGNLDTFSRAGLALALQAAGESAAADAVVANLIESVTTVSGKTFWSSAGEDGHYYQKTMSSQTRSTALALDALVQIRPDSPLIPNIVRWLMEQRKEYGWGSTNETSYSIIALTDHLLATSFSEAATSTPYTVLVNGVPVAEGRLGRGDPAVNIEIPSVRFQPGENELVVTQNGKTPLYYVLNTRVYLEQSEIAAAGEVEVSRHYYSAAGKEITKAKPGELVQVEVTVNMPADASYIIIEDHLPGGLEALNERLNTTGHVESAYDEPHYYWRDYGYNQKEVRGDRVAFFVTDFPQGRRTFSYYARATHAGTFVALPVEVSAMYDLTVWGRSASWVLIVEE
ncbi:MAG: Ig-like domain-containing protein [Anaerolineae bacterium]|nr:Ig-like domain-containing protein [Anaerolineae bacterium]